MCVCCVLLLFFCVGVFVVHVVDICFSILMVFIMFSLFVQTCC